MNKTKLILPFAAGLAGGILSTHLFFLFFLLWSYGFWKHRYYFTGYNNPDFDNMARICEAIVVFFAWPILFITDNWSKVPKFTFQYPVKFKEEGI